MHPTPQRARVSANLVFFTYGLLIGSYLPYFPFLKDRFGIGEGVFSLGLLAAAAGALISMPLAPLVMRWIGSRKAILYSSLIYLTVVAFAISAPTFVVFVILFFCLGLTISSWEVAANSQASVIEDKLNKPIISSVHGFWSLGTFVGSWSMARWLDADLNGLWLIYGLIVMGAIAQYFVYQGLLRRDQIAAESTTDRPNIKLKYLLYPPLIIVAFYQIVGFMLEGSFQDWGAFLIREIYLGPDLAIVPESQWDTLPAGEAEIRKRAAVAGGDTLACFTGTMTIGRMIGDRFVARLGRAGTLQLGGLIALVGILMTTLIDQTWAPFVGFGLVGLGTANIIPQVIKTADGTPGLPPGVAIAVITAVGFVAFLGGPVTVGFSGEYFTFRWTFLALSIFPLILLATAGMVMRMFAKPDPESN